MKDLRLFVLQYVLDESLIWEALLIFLTVILNISKY